MELSDLHVLVPNEFGGVDVCDVAALVNAFEDPDNEDRDPDEILLDVAIEQIEVFPTTLLNGVARVRRLNETGNVNEFWGIKEKSDGG